MDSPAGVLYLVNNYTGDRAAWEMARELQEAEGQKIGYLLVNDDVAVQDSTWTVGRRGVAGNFFVIKAVGAKADKGGTLEECVAVGEKVIANVRTMDQWMSRSLQTRKAPTILIAVFGGAALVLSGIGIYGVLAFGVAQRTREMGIRQALGADRGAIVKLVLGQGLRMTVIGVLIGLGGALGLSRYLESQLFGVSTRDRFGSSSPSKLSSRPTTSIPAL